MVAQQKTDFRRELKERRVLQLVGLYFGASWVAIEFTGFIADRYNLSPNLIDLILLSMLTMLPSVIVMAYTHGKPGKDEWTNTEKVVLPVNVLLTLSLIFYMFSGKELGATTHSVTLENEAGEMVERTVPKSAFRKRVALFFLTNETSSPDNQWIAWWTSYALHLDLMQDVYFDGRGPYQMAANLVDAGAPGGNPPLALMRQLAARMHMTYFLTGAVTAVEPYTIELRLHRTKGGRVIAAHNYTEADLGTLVDRAALDLKRDVDMAEAQIADALDLPVEALSSENPQALRLFAHGMQKLYFGHDYPGAYQSLARAARLDPTFAQAQFNLYKVSLLLGEEDSGAIRAAMQYIYKVPERLQGVIKEIYYLWQGQPELAQSALQLDATLFPDDVVAHRRLAQFYLRVADYGRALSEFEIIFNLNPDDDLVLRDMAEAYSAMGQFSRALKHLERFAGSNPRDSDVLMETGSIYQLLGRTDRAAKMYDRASLLGHNQARVLTQQGRVLFQEGRYDTAIAVVRLSVELAQSPDVKFAALQLLEEFYSSLGRIAEAMAVARQNMPVGRQAFGPMNSILLRLNHFSMYAQTTLADSVREMLRQFDLSVPPPWDQAIEVMFIVYKIRQQSVPISAEEVATVKQFYAEFKYIVDYPVEEVEAGIHLNNGEYLPAIQQLILTLSHYPRRLLVQKEMARAWRLLDDAQAAFTALEPLTGVYPHDPLVLYELYLIQREIDPAAARETLTRLADIWAGADDIFLPARKLREALAAAGPL